MPTGGGKSLCYALPSVVNNSITIVVSPLIALMEDQVSAMQAKGIRAEYLSSTRTEYEKQAILGSLKSEGNFPQLLYVTPEMTQTEKFMFILTSIYASGRLALFAIDEAHCISTWGHDFRPSYRRLAAMRDAFPRVPIMALTATATKKVQDEVVQALKLRNPQILISSFNRPNIHYEVVYTDVEQQDKYKLLIDMVQRPDSGPTCTIVYCLKQSTTAELAARLQGAGIASRAYHAGLPAVDRSRILEEFLDGRIVVVAATVAFGMGINKADVRMVVHFNVPKSLDALYQESGRAGRDGLPSRNVIFYSLDDRRLIEFVLEKEAKKSKRIANHTEESRVQAAFGKVVDYCMAPCCRRHKLLAHFDEMLQPSRCGGCCDFCRNPAGVQSRINSVREVAFDANLRRQGGQWARMDDESEDGYAGDMVGNHADMELQCSQSSEDRIAEPGEEFAQSVSKSRMVGTSDTKFFERMERAEQSFYAAEPSSKGSATDRLLSRMQTAPARSSVGKTKPVASADMRDKAVKKIAEYLEQNVAVKVTSQQAIKMAEAMEAEEFQGASTGTVYRSSIGGKLRIASHTEDMSKLPMLNTMQLREEPQDSPGN
ncbi:unnamed protein product [Ostreobium quekettii]|uniref:ATP-dependent DNA helicase n=1 Tax=Ostreobium quekettii TaxID=121088 RepID=A0A8S1J8N6_9CHLO|nr:unnamed protein product [Ostreobium quekettii]